MTFPADGFTPKAISGVIDVLASDGSLRELNVPQVDMGGDVENFADAFRAGLLAMKDSLATAYPGDRIIVQVTYTGIQNETIFDSQS